MVNIRILIYWGIDSLLMQYWTLKNHILVLHLESDFIFHMVYSFSSSWVKFIFVKKLVPYRVSITTLTRDHSSSASLLEESMTFFPSPSNVELFCLLETKSTTWHSKKKKIHIIMLRECFHKFERSPVPQNPLIRKDATSATLNIVVV